MVGASIRLPEVPDYIGEAVRKQEAAAAELLKELSVHLDVLAPCGRNGKLIEYGVYRANGDTVGAIDARGGVDEILGRIGLGGDAVYRADLSAGGVFYPVTGFCNDEWHSILVMGI